jgi:hypothetical protein
MTRKNKKQNQQGQNPKTPVVATPSATFDSVTAPALRAFSRPFQWLGRAGPSLMPCRFAACRPVFLRSLIIQVGPVLVGL